MSFRESILVALFIMSIAFFVLFSLFLCILLVSYILRKNKSSHNAMADEMKAIAEPSSDANGNTSSGEVCLNNVDDKTAAMLMAIIADESGIPLSELRFKSIRQLP